MSGRSSTAARTASPCWTRPAWCGSGIRPRTGSPGRRAQDAIGKPPSFPLPDPGSTLTHKLPNGRWLDVLCTSLADRGELVIDFRDVTAAKELEEAKDLFLATTSHELRTPITVVQGFASTLASRWDQLARRRTAGRGADHRGAGRVARQAGRAAAARLAGRRRPAARQQRPVRPRRRAARGRRRVPAAVGQARRGGGHPRRPAGRQRRHHGHRHHRRAAARERLQVLARRRHGHASGPG